MVVGIDEADDWLDVEITQTPQALWFQKTEEFQNLPSMF